MKLKQFDDIQLYVRENDWGFWQNDSYEPEETALIKKLVQSNFVCLDIGANLGYFTMLMAKQCKTVWSYEPEASNYQLLRKNIILNKTFNVYVNRVALTEHSGEALLYLSPTNNGMNRIFQSVLCNGSIIVKTQKFDEAWNNLNRYDIDFIKMDAEGSELGVLKGMRVMLQECHPIILMEFHPTSIIEYGANPKDVYDFMKDLGYSIRLIPYSDEEITYEKLLEETMKEPSGRNILCQK